MVLFPLEVFLDVSSSGSLRMVPKVKIFKVFRAENVSKDRWCPATPGPPYTRWPKGNCVPRGKCRFNDALS